MESPQYTEFPFQLTDKARAALDRALLRARFAAWYAAWCAQRGLVPTSPPPAGAVLAFALVRP